LAIKIRPAIEAEQEEINRIIKEAGINPRQLDWQRFLVADDEGKVIAIGQVKPHGDEVRELASLAVIPEHKGQGWGRKMVEALLEQEEGKIFLICKSLLEPYYNRFGFHTLKFKEMPSYYQRLYLLANLVLPIMGLFQRRKLRLLVMVKEAV